MRVWLDPDKLAARGANAGRCRRAALREQNVQVAAGRIGQPPAPAGLDFQLPVITRGRLSRARRVRRDHRQDRRNGQRHVAFATSPASSAVRKNYDMNSYLDGRPSVGVAVFQLPGPNALAAAKALRARWINLKTAFPRASTTASSTTRRCSSTNRSTRSTRR